MKMNRRKFERTTLDESIELVIEQVRVNEIIYNNVTVFIDEVSLEGIRFITDIDIEMEQYISFDLPTVNNFSLIKGRIAWKEQLDGNYFHYGLQILNEM